MQSTDSSSSAYYTPPPSISEDSQQPDELDRGQSHSEFSYGDAVWVVMRSIATAAECVNFVCRRVVLYSGMLLWGVKGLIQCVHENQNNEPLLVGNARTDRRLPDRNIQKAAHRVNNSVRKNWPAEEYFRQATKDGARLLQEPVGPESKYSWMFLIGNACGFLASLYALGIFGAVILYTPSLLGAEPFIIFDLPNMPRSYLNHLKPAEHNATHQFDQTINHFDAQPKENYVREWLSGPE